MSTTRPTPTTPRPPSRKPLTRIGVAALAIVVGAGLSACGSDDAPEGQPASAATEPDASDEAVAAAAVISGDDVPDGWGSLGKPEQNDDDPFNNPSDGCEYLKAVGDGGPTTAKVVGDDYASADGTDQIASTVRVYAEESDASEVIALLADARTADCISSFLSASVTASERDVTVERLDVAPVEFPIGEDNAGFRIELTASSAGHSFDSVIGIAFVREGRGIGYVNASRFDTDFDDELMAGFTATVDDGLGDLS